MLEKFLKAKHWQLFLLTIGIPMIFQFVLMASMISEISSGNEPNPEQIFNHFRVFSLMMILFMGVLFGWLWSIGIGLDKKIPDKLKLKVGRFKIFLFLPIIYILFFSIFMDTMMHGMMGTGSEPNPTIFILIIPLHLFSMFCIFYCLYFVAKTIKTAELQKEVGFVEFAGEFFLIWFFPIGIWFVQPKINQMINE